MLTVCLLVLLAAQQTPAPLPESATGPTQPAYKGFGEPWEQTLTRFNPVRVGGSVRTPKKIRDARPRYPLDAERVNARGVVGIEIVVDKAGAVANARVVRSVPMLDAAAVDAVRRWVFAPTEIDGQAVAVLMSVTVNFHVQGPQ